MHNDIDWFCNACAETGFSNAFTRIILYYTSTNLLQQAILGTRNLSEGPETRSGGQSNSLTPELSSSMMRSTDIRDSLEGRDIILYTYKYPHACTRCLNVLSPSGKIPADAPSLSILSLAGSEGIFQLPANRCRWWVGRPIDDVCYNRKCNNCLLM